MVSNKMSFERKFLPVGQGAFYVEVHKNGKDKFTIVYDCGSTTLDSNIFKKLIKGSFKDDTQIDILFISHFHKDHINGIKFLSAFFKIKKVVMPYLDDDEKLIFKILNNFENVELIDSPQNFFGDTELIFINSTNVDTINNPNISILKNGSIFYFNHWIFRPFNFKYTDRKVEFINNLALEGLELTDIDTISKAILNEKKIKRAYEKIPNGLNVNSMALYSGPKKDYPHKYWLVDSINKTEYRSGCIYFGDIDLKHLNTLKELTENIKDYLEFIGTIQVPHHGSKYNFNDEIFKCIESIKCAIFSYGTTNTYGHPSQIVISDLFKNNIEPVHVTEFAHSGLFQFCR